MVDASSNSITNISLFIIQIVSAVSGFIIAASVTFLRKWHPPMAYTTAFHISFWIGVQAIITHSGSAISVRLPDSSIDMQRNEPLVRFLVWTQFAMPLWFVFLNATIATDLMLSQLFRLSVAKLQVIHKWYVPLATSMAFTLAFPLLIYHSEYRPKANVFSVQFPSALSVTLYYILAFDLWIATGIVYCFVVVSLVVCVIVIKLRKKRAAWSQQQQQTQTQMESGWVSPLPVDSSGGEQRQQYAASEPDGQQREPGSNSAIQSAGGQEASGTTKNVQIDPRHVCTFSNYHSPEQQPLQPAYLKKDDQEAVNNSVLRGDTLISDGLHPGEGCTLGTSDNALPCTPATAVVAIRRNSISFAVEERDMEPAFLYGRPAVRNTLQLPLTADKPVSSQRISLRLRTAQTAPGSAVHLAIPVTSHCQGQQRQGEYASGATIIGGNGAIPVIQVQGATSPCESQSSDLVVIPVSANNNGSGASNVQAVDEGSSRGSGRNRRPVLTLENIPTPATLQNHRSTYSGHSSGSSSPFRIPTLALVRLLLYPLIPILSFTLMCVVRWVWFRSTMPSRWEVLSVASGMLRAMEGFLCLIVFLLNPALNRSFREIRKRSTPVFSQ
ncbi:hypothetical protein GQ54DRAFT_310533 [Martensiomyces pterosporus]|nr:hypothetical protein GQ54DRAFT_310533 [Martensiomyces pterosporus]